MNARRKYFYDWALCLSQWHARILTACSEFNFLLNLDYMFIMLNVDAMFIMLICNVK